MKQVTRIAEIELGDKVKSFDEIEIGERLSCIHDEMVCIVTDKHMSHIKLIVLYSQIHPEGTHVKSYPWMWRKINNLLLRTENV